MTAGTGSACGAEPTDRTADRMAARTGAASRPAAIPGATSTAPAGTAADRTVPARTTADPPPDSAAPAAAVTAADARFAGTGDRGAAHHGPVPADAAPWVTAGRRQRLGGDRADLPARPAAVTAAPLRRHRTVGPGR